MTLLTIFVQYAMGAVLCLSAGTKLFKRYRIELRGTIAQIVPLRDGYMRALSVAITAGELSLALCIVSGLPSLPFAALMTALLLSLFSLALAVPLSRGESVNCACFGPASGVVGSRTFARNGILIAASVFLTRSTRDPASLTVAVLVGVMVAYFGHRLVVANSTLRQMQHDMPPPLQPPRLGVSVADRLPMSPSGKQKQIVLGILSPGCGGCVRSPRPLADIAIALKARPMAVIDRWGASTDETQELECLLTDAGVDIGPDDLWQALRTRSEVTGYPSFVLVDTEGTISASVLGLENLSSLAQQTANQ